MHHSSSWQCHLVLISRCRVACKQDTLLGTMSNTRAAPDIDDQRNMSMKKNRTTTQMPQNRGYGLLKVPRHAFVFRVSSKRDLILGRLNATFSYLRLVTAPIYARNARLHIFTFSWAHFHRLIMPAIPDRFRRVCSNPTQSWADRS